MLDYAGLERKRNDNWICDELIYKGNLYHYTDDVGYKGILDPHKINKERIEIPEDCIALRLTEISSTIKNDNKERQHINITVRKVANDLYTRGEVNKGFAEQVINFEPTYRDIYTITTDEIYAEFGSNIIKIGYGKIDYYVVCFSKNPNNEHIKEEFHAQKCFAFKKELSNQVEETGRIGGIKISIPEFYTRLNPYLTFQKCKLKFNFGTVIYDDFKKSEIIKNELLQRYKVYKGLSDETRKKREIEEMYALYDAFFKNENYCNEEEVRLVVRVPHDDSGYLEKNGIAFDGENKKYIYIPINKIFLINDNNDIN